jgi:hypothetical protein
MILFGMVQSVLIQPPAQVGSAQLQAKPENRLALEVGSALFIWLLKGFTPSVPSSLQQQGGRGASAVSAVHICMPHVQGCLAAWLHPQHAMAGHACRGGRSSRTVHLLLLLLLLLLCGFISPSSAFACAAFYCRQLRWWLLLLLLLPLVYCCCVYASAACMLLLRVCC